MNELIGKHVELLMEDLGSGVLSIRPTSLWSQNSFRENLTEGNARLVNRALRQGEHAEFYSAMCIGELEVCWRKEMTNSW